MEKNVGSSLKKDLVKHEDVKFLDFSCLKKTLTFEALYGTQDSFFGKKFLTKLKFPGKLT